MLAYACQNNLSIIQIDVKTAFLNAELEECIFMEQPEGFVDKERPDHVYLLRRALYELKQAARAWNTLCDTVLVSMGCIVSAADRSLYILQCEEGVIFILVYVDDMLLIGKSVESLTVLVSSIARHFDI